MWREQLASSVMYHPAGSFLGFRELLAGYRMLWGRLEFDAPHYFGPAPQSQVDNYQLVYDRVGGLPYQPVEFRATNLPVTGTSRYNDFGMYFADTWRPTRRLTLNLGMRWQRAVGYVEEGNKVRGDSALRQAFPGWMLVAGTRWHPAPAWPSTCSGMARRSPRARSDFTSMTSRQWAWRDRTSFTATA